MGVYLVAAFTCKCNVALVTRVEPTALSALTLDVLNQTTIYGD